MDRATVEPLATGEYAVMDWEASASENPCHALTKDEEKATHIADLLNRGETSEAVRLGGHDSPEDVIRNG